LNLMLALVLAAIPPAGDGGGLQDMLTTLGLPIAVLGLFYFLILRPQQQQRRQHQAAVGAIKRGDSVVLSSGVIGKVVRVEDKELGVEVAQNVTIKVIKSMVAEVRARGEPAPANDSKS
jgi:preprotein translocase subunit YajC